MTTKPEQLESLVFKYDRSKSIRELALGRSEDGYLLSINKKYSNNEYFGACNTFLVIKEKTPSIYRHFKCKDRGFTEEFVDNKDAFIDHVLKNHLKPVSTWIKEINDEVYIKQDIKLDKIVGRDFKIEYCFFRGEYHFTNFVFDDPPAVFRGLYGSNESSYENGIKEFGIAIPPKSTPTFEDLLYLRNQAEISLSNVYHEVATDYSHIKGSPV